MFVFVVVLLLALTNLVSFPCDVFPGARVFFLRFCFCVFSEQTRWTFRMLFGHIDSCHVLQVVEACICIGMSVRFVLVINCVRAVVGDMFVFNRVITEEVRNA